MASPSYRSGYGDQSPALVTFPSQISAGFPPQQQMPQNNNYATSMNATFLPPPAGQTDDVNQNMGMLNLRLQRKVDGEIKTKLTRLQYQIGQITSRKELINIEANNIERDAQQEFQGITERLTFAENSKAAALAHETKVLENFIDDINQTINDFNAFLRDQSINPDHVEDVLEMLMNRTEMLVSRDFVTTLAASPDDLPRELDQVRQYISTTTKTWMMQQNMRNEGLWNAFIQLREARHQKTQFRIPEREARALQEPTEYHTYYYSPEKNCVCRAAMKFANRLRDKFTKTCFYCGNILNEYTVNLTCEPNVLKNLPSTFKPHTVEAPPSEWHGSKQHFWGIRKVDVPLHFQTKFQEIKPQDVEFFRRKLLFFELSLSLIRKRMLQENISLEALFGKHDPDKKGLILPLYFKYALFHTLGLPEVDVDLMSNFLQDGEMINFRELLKILSDTGKYFSTINDRLQPSKEHYQKMTEGEFGGRLTGLQTSLLGANYIRYSGTATSIPGYR